jgi:hypothetical protein
MANMRVGRPDIPTIVAANSAKAARWRPRDRDVGPRFGNGFDQNKASGDARKSTDLRLIAFEKCIHFR